MTDVAALLFDKDGTLFDFTATWGRWTEDVIADLSRGDAALAARIAQVLGYDAGTRRFHPASPVIAHTTAEVGELLAPVLGLADPVPLIADLNARSGTTPQVPAVDLPACLGALRRRGLRLGLVTNDGEASARAHLSGAGVAGLFDFIAGYDSGFGAKPAPGQLLAFAAGQDLAPARVAMVGDSLHDMAAARAAGMRAIGVLTGPAGPEVLTPAADVVLESIAGIAGWLDSGAPARRV